MSGEEKAGEEIISRLKLDIRGLTLLYDSDAKLRPILERSFVDSQDEYVRRFMELTQQRRPPEEGRSLPIALGELVLASFLMIAGLAAFVPAMVGLGTPQEWVTYLTGAASPWVSSGPLYSGLPILDFALAALLLLGAFYSLRRASKELKSAGLILESSGS